mmetsp:Transcript_28724/g.79085  ORF Transcript_28724/g.79085 Transcript_28724/m.79085 type:complete len:213 (+) Transcript_28724:552-1190(+)
MGLRPFLLVRSRGRQLADARWPHVQGGNKSRPRDPCDPLDSAHPDHQDLQSPYRDSEPRHGPEAGGVAEARKCCRRGVLPGVACGAKAIRHDDSEGYHTHLVYAAHVAKHDRGHLSRREAELWSVRRRRDEQGVGELSGEHVQHRLQTIRKTADDVHRLSPQAEGDEVRQWLEPSLLFGLRGEPRLGWLLERSPRPCRQREGEFRRRQDNVG